MLFLTNKLDYIMQINVKNCSLCTTYNGEMTHRKQQKKIVPWGTDGRLPLSGDFRSLIVV